MWAFLDLDLLDAAVTGRPHEGLAAANRGLMALDPLAQRAEAALWSEYGPAWPAARTTVTDVTDPGADGAEEGIGRFRFTWQEAGGETGRATVSIRRAGAVPVPSCGAPLEEATKTSPTFEVLGIEPS